MDIPKAGKRRHCPTENTEQCHLMQWARLTRTPGPDGVPVPIADFLFFIPNGGNLSKAQRGRFKEMGLKSGVSDLFLPIPRAGYHGLWVELKAQNGTVQKAQQQWLDRMSAQGYAACVAYGWHEAADEIIGYLEAQEETARQLSPTG